MTLRMRHVPPSGAKVKPVRRTCWICAAMPTVNASTRRLGSDSDTCPQFTGSLITSPTTPSMPLKSAVDNDVRLTSS